MRFECKTEDLKEKVSTLMPTHGLDGYLLTSWGEDDNIELVVRNEGKTAVAFITSSGNSFRIPAQWIEYGKEIISLSIFVDLLYKVWDATSGNTRIILDITDSAIKIYKLNN